MMESSINTHIGKFFCMALNWHDLLLTYTRLHESKYLNTGKTSYFGIEVCVNIEVPLNQ